MKTTMKSIIMLILILLLVVPAQSAQAKGFIDGKVIFGDNFTLPSGQTLDGDLVVFGGNVTIEETATVKGSIVVFGGTITQDGDVEQDIVIFGGQINLGKAALVKGDVVTIGGQIERATGATIEGEVVENIPAPTIRLPNPANPPEVPQTPEIPNLPRFNVDFDPFGKAFGVVFNALAVAALAMLLAIFLQPQIERVSQVIVEQPLVSGGFGLLTVMLAPFALLIMIVTILLIPVAIIGVILLVLAWLFGIIAIGQEVGDRFTKAINQTWAPVLSIGLGTFLLMLVGGFIGMVPCIGRLVPILIGFVAVGGAVMTMFGTRLVHHPEIVAPAEPLPPAS
jgi:hypothetical protein